MTRVRKFSNLTIVSNLKFIGQIKRAMTQQIKNHKLINKSELARIYFQEYGESISSQYIRALLNPTDKRKNPEQLKKIKNIIANNQKG